MSESENKVDAIINDINQLTDEEKRELTIKVRTTIEGNKAYTSFLYGIGGEPSKPAVEEPNCDNPTHSTTETPNTTNEDTGSNSVTPNPPEEWL